MRNENSKLKNAQSPRVAIVHDWFVGGGAEKVVEAIHELYPEAPIYTSYCSDEWREKLGDVVKTGYLQKWPFSKLRKFLPVLRQHWFSHLDLSNYDIIISSSGAEAKGVRKSRTISHLPSPKSQLHINYCHAPTHYYWSRYDEYFSNPGFGIFNPLARFGLKILVNPMRKWDYAAAQGPDILIANSTHIASEIQKYYDRDAVVIHPPVDLTRFTHLPTTKPQTAKKRSGFVAAGRQVPYKRIDLAISACNELSLPLVVVGKGPEHDKLRKMAGPTITFRSNVSDAEMTEAFASAEGFIFPGLDDFGITPVEAMAAGTPVIAYKAGGALDTVTENISGTLFFPQTIDALKEALVRFQKKSYSHDRIRIKAQEFSKDAFKAKLKELIDKCYINENRKMINEK